jgi:hypothetical protein
MAELLLLLLLGLHCSFIAAAAILFAKYDAPCLAAVNDEAPIVGGPTVETEEAAADGPAAGRPAAAGPAAGGSAAAEVVARGLAAGGTAAR